MSEKFLSETKNSKQTKNQSFWALEVIGMKNQSNMRMIIGLMNNCCFSFIFQQQLINLKMWIRYSEIFWDKFFY